MRLCGFNGESMAPRSKCIHLFEHSKVMAADTELNDPCSWYLQPPGLIAHKTSSGKKLYQAMNPPVDLFPFSLPFITQVAEALKKHTTTEPIELFRFALNPSSREQTVPCRYKVRRCWHAWITCRSKTSLHWAYWSRMDMQSMRYAQMVYSIYVSARETPPTPTILQVVFYLLLG